MKIALASDFHLANSVDSSNVTNKANSWHPIENVIDFLKFLESRADKVYLLGDIFEGWRCSFKASIKKHKEVWDYIKRSDKIIYIRGNHDFASIFKLKNARDTFRLGKYLVHVEHGNFYDFENNGWMWLATILEIFFRFLGIIFFPLRWIIMRLFGNLIISKLSEEKLAYIDYSDETSEPSISDFDIIEESEVLEPSVRPDRLERAAMKLLKLYNIVVFGHTHRRKIVKVDNSHVYINTGRCNLHYYEWTEIEENNGQLKYSLFKLASK